MNIRPKIRRKGVEKVRKINFRSWDKRNNKWFHPDLIIMTNAGFYEDYRAFEDGSSLFDYEYELMQYIGLKDKNGKRIYEGDVVPLKVWHSYGWKQGGREQKCNTVVRYSEKSLGFVFEGVDKQGGKFTRLYNPGIKDSYLVIGNIYENPELI